jgi:glycosyltransferase involved in cell wall biosynthesis
MAGTLADRQLGGFVSERSPANDVAGDGAGTSNLVSIVMPCFNEEGGIRRVMGDVVAAMAQCGSAWELICIDDGSTDDTASQLQQGADGHPDCRVVVLQHGRNHGYGAALKTGVRHARGDIIVITDADGTYPISEIPALIERCKHADMVVGARIGDGVVYSWIRRIPKVFLRRYVSWIVGEDVPDMNSGLRAFRRDIAMKFLPILPDGFSFTTTITLAMMTNRYLVQFVPISYAKRLGKSKIQPIRDTLRFTALITRTGMYFAPLRILTPACIVLSAAFAVSLSFDLYRRDLTEATLILLLFAMNTAMLGLLADMIAKRGPA